ncbi:glycosyltransferase [Vibrio breoganii]|uniref:glycosyltransferase n=1 Tax=Vibrio breoganii TaxID=553239 RepID=UPI0021C4B1BA|nr:glycosyltransferase [Vibrio breoganii]MDN3715933.1 glycosyltransferase [Vibrio breoganii]
MHVCIIPSWYPSGKNDVGGSFFREQAIALKRYGHKVGVISHTQIPITQANIGTYRINKTSYEIDEGVFTYRNSGWGWLPKVPYGNSWLSVENAIKLFESYIKDNGMPDILHAHSLFNGGIQAFEINKRFGVPYVITEHSTAFSRGTVKPWQEKYATKVLRSASRAIAVSEPFSALLNNYFDETIDWIYVPNLLSKNFEYQKISSRKKVDKYQLCNVSMLEDKKGLDILLRSFSKAFYGNKNVILKIAGDGSKKTELITLAKDLGISDQVEFLGMKSRNDVVELMQQSHTYVLTSRIETFGVVLIEALSLGVPIIATACGGPESIVNKDNGLLVDVNDIDGVANAMLEILENYEGFVPKEIREDCLTRFSEKAVVARLTDLYSDVLFEKK